MNHLNTPPFELTRQPNYKNPILDIAASTWEDDRYDAAQICYRYMRRVDDLVDTYKESTSNASTLDNRQITTLPDNLTQVFTDLPGISDETELVAVIQRFQLPLWPWRKFVDAMIYDIHHDGFPTFSSFLRYAEGAAVAPASIFLHLCGVINKNDRYVTPQFDVRSAARPAALFSYLVHIIRDFQKDQNHNLNYFAHNLLSDNGLDPHMLRDVAAGGRISPGFRRLIQTYHSFAEYYRRETRRIIDQISIYLNPRYLLSVEMVYNLYSLIFKRINCTHGKFTTEELIPSPDEMEACVTQTISSFKFTRQ